jgi:hypothetical protein
MARRANHFVIPEAAQRLSGIHLSRRLVAKWIPGLRLAAQPGMTTLTTGNQPLLSFWR